MGQGPRKSPPRRLDGAAEVSRSFLSFLTGDFNYVTLLEDLRSLILNYIKICGFSSCTTETRRTWAWTSLQLGERFRRDGDPRPKVRRFEN